MRLGKQRTRMHRCMTPSDCQVIVGVDNRRELRRESVSSKSHD